MPFAPVTTQLHIEWHFCWQCSSSHTFANKTHLLSQTGGTIGTGTKAEAGAGTGANKGAGAGANTGAGAGAGMLAICGTAGMIALVSFVAVEGAGAGAAAPAAAPGADADCTACLPGQRYCAPLT